VIPSEHDTDVDPRMELNVIRKNISLPVIYHNNSKLQFYYVRAEIIGPLFSRFISLLSALMDDFRIYESMKYEL